MAKTPDQVALSQQTRTRAPVDPARAAARAKNPQQESEKTARLAARAALEKKAEDVVIVDLRDHSSYADFLVICSGTNERQLDAVTGGVEEALKEAGHRPVGEEGQNGGRWILIDFGDVVVHVFHQDERGYYDLEGLWADAPQERLAAQ